MMDVDKDKLSDIDDLRCQMYKAIEESESLASPKVIKISQKLDKALNEYKPN